MTLNGVPPSILQHETVWMDSYRFHDAERQHQEMLALKSTCTGNSHAAVSAAPKSSIASEIAHARQKIQNFLKSQDAGTGDNQSSLLNRIEQLEREKKELRKDVQAMTSKLDSVLAKLSSIEHLLPASKASQLQVQKQEQKAVTNGPANADDDDIDLFGSDEETEEEARVKEERLQAYAAKKSKKPALVAKSSVVLDVKPWSDETDMKAMENSVREITMDGLKWGAGKLVPLAFGIKKFQIVAVVEDDKVSIDLLQEKIEEIEELVQSVDIAAFNKL